DGGSSEFPGKCSEVFANRIGSKELALEFQLQNRGRGKLLCHRRDQEQGVRRVWDPFRPSTVPVGLSQYWLSSIEQEKAAGESVGFPGGHDAVEFRGRSSADNLFRRQMFHLSGSRSHIC